MKHIVKRHMWQDGILKTFENIFNTLEDAMEFGLSIIEAESVKIYNELGELIHAKSSHDHNTYA